MVKMTGKEAAEMVKEARREEREQLIALFQNEIDNHPMEDWDYGWNAGVKTCTEIVFKRGDK